MMVIAGEKVFWRTMVAGLPALDETLFGIIVHELSPRGVEERIQREFAVVEKLE